MIDASDVRSGFDIEILLGAGYVRQMLLSAIDSGDFPTRLDLALDGSVLGLTIHPPSGVKRRYKPTPVKSPSPVAGSFDVQIVFNDRFGANLTLVLNCDISIQLGAGAAPTRFNGVALTLHIAFAMQESVDTRGAMVGAALTINVLNVGAGHPVVDALLQGAMPLVLATVNEIVGGLVDADMFGDGSMLQAARSLSLPGGDRTDDALGLYLNFKLRDGVDDDDFMPPRGDTSRAVNFLPAGDDLAMAMPGGVYAALAADALYRLAQPVFEGVESGGGHYHPIRQQGADGGFHDVAVIDRIEIGAGKARYVKADGSKSKKLDALEITIRGEYTEVSAYQPRFKLRVFLIPVVSRGLLEWRTEYELDLNLLAEAIPFLFFYALLFVFGPVAGALLAGQWVALSLAGQEFAAEDLALDQIAGTVNSQTQQAASLLDALPHRVTMLSRRWDPFYFTDHQLVTELDGFALDDDGIRMHGRAALDKQPRPVTHVLLRDEERNVDRAITGLRYRIEDHRSYKAWFEPVFAATDRRSFEQVDEDGVPANVYRLGVAEAIDRIASNRILASVPYLPRKVHIVRNQVQGLLVISQTERDEQEAELIDRRREYLRQREKKHRYSDYLAEAVAQLLHELGGKPTADEIDERINALIDDATRKALERYIERRVPGLLEAALDALSQLDLSPHEFGVLQEERLLLIRGFDRIQRHGRFYYRDRADASVADNLMSLPGYKPA